MIEQEEIISINDVNIWTCKSGVGAPLFLIPGGPGLGDYLSPLAQLFDNFFQVIRFEPRGCGRSDKKPPYDILTTLNDIEALREHFGFKKWLVGGHSSGGTISLVYALEFPESVEGIVCIAGVGVQNDIDWKEQVKKNYEERGERQPDFKYPLNEEVRKETNFFWEKYIQQPELWKRISKLDKPFLIIQGENDIRPNWPAKQLSYLLPKAQYVEIEGAEHWLWETHPEELRKHVQSFITKNELSNPIQ